TSGRRCATTASGSCSSRPESRESSAHSSRAPIEALPPPSPSNKLSLGRSRRATRGRRRVGSASVYPIVVLLLDGLADRAHAVLCGKTGNEAAETANLDRFAAGGSCGVLYAVGPGRAPSSE